MSLRNRKKSIFVIAGVSAKPECVEAVKRACQVLAETSQGEAGCVFYNLFQTANAPHIFIFFEEWKTPRDLKKHLASRHAAEFDAAVEDLLLDEEEIIYLKKII